MTRHMKKIIALGVAGFAAAGCAQNTDTLSTASVAPDKVAAASAPKIDPACVSLANQIDTLRKEGTVDRLEKAAVGKGKSVQVTRDALGKQAELNKANADFQTRCGPQMPKAQTAAATPTPATAAPVATATAASATQAAQQAASNVAATAATTAATAAAKKTAEKAVSAATTAAVKAAQ